jgi:hypothetical protein
MTALSDITVADLIVELEINPLFALRTEDEQMEWTSTVTQTIASWYIEKESDKYKDNTLTGF